MYIELNLQCIPFNRNEGEKVKSRKVNNTKVILLLNCCYNFLNYIIYSIIALPYEVQCEKRFFFFEVKMKYNKENQLYVHDVSCNEKKQERDGSWLVEKLCFAAVANLEKVSVMFLGRTLLICAAMIKKR